MADLVDHVTFRPEEYVLINFYLELSVCQCYFKYSIHLFENRTFLSPNKKSKYTVKTCRMHTLMFF